MLGHNSFDFALTPTNRVFMANVTTSGIYKWTNGKWADGQAPNWTTDTRTWDYEGYTITQTSRKQAPKVGDPFVYKYQDTVIATDKDGKQIHEIVGPTLTYDDKTNKFSDIDPDRNTLATAMQNYLDDADPDSDPDTDPDTDSDTDTDTDPNDCASENRVKETDDSCGDCLSGYTEDETGACVADSDETEEKKTNWLLWGGLAAVGVLALTM